MRYALLTVANPTIAFVSFAHYLAQDHILLTTRGTGKQLIATGVSRVRELHTAFPPLPLSVDATLFKTIDASLYTTLTHGRQLCTSGDGWDEIRVVVAGFKPCEPPFGPHNRPDVGGPTLAKVAALAALYHKRTLFVLAGSNLTEEDYREFLLNYFSELPEKTRLINVQLYAKRALQAVAAYEAEVAGLVMRE
ncbi:hypothetical protein HY091_01950 [Candidatus Kaiserbacteria bacterium]|nr:hypothetical protein [Candidatus Kaiserbacteria bacterium]